MFVVIPFALTETGGLDKAHHWQVYLPAVVAGFILMVPAIIYGGKNAINSSAFLSVRLPLMMVAQSSLGAGLDHFSILVAALVLYFIAFNILKPACLRWSQKIAPPEAKGTAMGVYNTAQSLGLFIGGALGGWLYQHVGASAVFIFCAGLMFLWWIAALTMQAPQPVKLNSSPSLRIGKATRARWLSSSASMMA